MLAVEPKAIQGVAVQLGRLLNVTGVRATAFCRLLSWQFHLDAPESFSPQGKFSKQTLNEIGTFLKYMETRNNVKVRKKNHLTINVLRLRPGNSGEMRKVHPLLLWFPQFF